MSSSSASHSSPSTPSAPPASNNTPTAPSTTPAASTPSPAAARPVKRQTENDLWNYTEADELKFKLSDIIKPLLGNSKDGKRAPEGVVKGYRTDLTMLHILLSRVQKYYTTPAAAQKASATTSSMTPPKSPAQPLLELQAPINICGDTHGQYSDLLRIFNSCGAPTKTTYLFLGDYIDRGRHSLEVITLLFALKLAVPKKVHLLRGNHELKAINKNYGFYAEIKDRYRNSNIEKQEKLYTHFNVVFSYMPLAAIVSKRILCMHGGISPHLKSLDDIRGIGLPLETAKSNPLACDLLWADPEKTANGFEPNKIRAISHIFGKKEVDDLCKRLDIDLIIRAHQVVEYGYAFFADRRLITVFSASRYQDELHNYAAVVIVNDFLELSFVQLKPEEFEKRREEQEKAGGMNQEQVTANTN